MRRIDEDSKKGMQHLTDVDGIQRGCFFNTSGTLGWERIRPDAKYDYVWKTELKAKGTK